jgi:hypothetical protein
VKTTDDLDCFYDWWRDIIEHLKDRNVAPVSMDELKREAGLAAL